MYIISKNSFNVGIVMDEVKTGLGVGIILVLIGLAMLGFSFYEAYNAYLNYKPVMPSAGEDLAQAVSSASFELINLAARLAFIGIMVWAGAVVLKYGVELVLGEKELKKKKKEKKEEKTES